MTEIEAVSRAKQCVWKAFVHSYRVGEGMTVVEPTAPSLEESMRYGMIGELRDSVEELESMLPPGWVPEVGMNFVYALPSALTPAEVCEMEGRIAPSRGRAVHAECIDFGASQHVATIALTAMSFDRCSRSALNLRFSEKNLEDLKESGLLVGSFSREEEPQKGGRTMEWGTGHAIEEMGTVPDAIFDRGDVGKEPMIRVLGKDPSDILSKVGRIIGQR
jgi:hydroxymethylpyrimidine/phosphomethylpyrimidine kinase